MTYKTIIMEARIKAKKLAAAIEQRANEQAREGWELVNFAITGTGKAILVFRSQEDAPEVHTQEETAEEAAIEEAAQEDLLEETAEAVGEDA